MKILKEENSLKCQYRVIERNQHLVFQKKLILLEEPWKTLFVREIEFYKSYKTKYEKIRRYIPSLISFNESEYLLELDFISCDSILESRYVERLPQERLDNIFKFNEACSSYRKKIDIGDFDLNRSLNKLKASNLFSRKTISDLESISYSIDTLYLCNGDLLAKNILFPKSAQDVIVIDWEFYGYKPKFYDLALLYITIRDPHMKERILKYVFLKDAKLFLFSLSLHLEKEIRIHKGNEEIAHELGYLTDLVNIFERRLINEV